MNVVVPRCMLEGEKLFRREPAENGLLTNRDTGYSEWSKVAVPQSVERTINITVSNELKTGHFRDRGPDRDFPSVYATHLSEAEALASRRDLVGREVRKLLYTSRGDITEGQILGMLDSHSSDSIECWGALKEANRVLDCIASYEAKRRFSPDERKEVRDVISSIGNVESLILLNRIRRMRGEAELAAPLSELGVNNSWPIK